MKKYSVALFALFLMLPILSSCGGNKSKNNTRAIKSTMEEYEITSIEDLASVKADRAYQIGVSLPGSEDGYQSALVEELRASAKEKSVELTVRHVTDGHEEQVKQLQEFVQNKVDAIIVEVVDDHRSAELVEVVRRTPLIFLGRSPDIELKANQMTYVGTNDEVVGKFQGEFLAEYFKAKEKDSVQLCLMNGDAKSKFIEKRVNALTKYLEADDIRVELVYEGIGDWNKEKARRELTKFLETDTEFDAVVCQNDDMALGCVAALKDAELNPLSKPVVGMDGTTEALAALAEDELAFTVYQNTSAQGKASVDAAIFLANKEENLSVFLDIPYEPVSKINLEKYPK
ncbi:MAG: sugar ABC transporter substrate-binding protein [Fastidiosipilaceae bacterium]|jgi:inositol transport system substrate-binding protein